MKRLRPSWNLAASSARRGEGALRCQGPFPRFAPVELECGKPPLGREDRVYLNLAHQSGNPAVALGFPARGNLTTTGPRVSVQIVLAQNAHPSTHRAGDSRFPLIVRPCARGVKTLRIALRSNLSEALLERVDHTRHPVGAARQHLGNGVTRVPRLIGDVQGGQDGHLQ